jgi:hypothetical protein
MKKSLLLLTLISSVCLLSDCGGGASTPPPATHFSVVPAGAAVTAGTAFNVIVTALDAANGVVTGYAGTVQFASSDGKAVLPANSPLTSGTGTFSVTLETTGGQTIMATDTVTASIEGTSSAITVGAPAAPNAVALINLPLSPDAVIPGGAAFTLKVNGTGFVSGAIVRWNGSNRVTTFVSESQVTAAVLASDAANFDTGSVTVVNPSPGGGTSNAVSFETTRPTPSVSWSISSELAAGSAPSASVAAADFTGNDKLDLAVVNGGSNNISIFLGNGDGTFQTAVNYPAGTNPDSVAVGDFNGDGELDLAVANADSNNVSIFLGKGDGTFQTAVNYPAGTNPDSVAVGDFNGDGKLDLAVANAGSNNVSILLGRGDGTFQIAVDYGAASNPTSVAVGDFNGDGKLDLAVANQVSSNVSILLGAGDGTFQTAVEYGTATSPTSVAVGDFNGDGRLDLAVANNGSSNFRVGSVSILLGNGDGTFQTHMDYAALSNSSSVIVGDFNGDNKLDLAVANRNAGGADVNNLSLFLGNGDGTFQAQVDYAAGSNPSSVVVGDFNGDGRLDLAVADQASSKVSVLLQPGLVSGPDARLLPGNLDFATQLVGTTSAGQSVQLTNYGSMTLSIAVITTTVNFGETDDCGASLAAGASCTINVTFAPGAIKSLTGTLSITDNAPGSPQMVSLNGVGTVAKLVPASMYFVCSQTCPPGPKAATLTNTGTTALSITSITITSNKPGVNAQAGFAQMNNCPASLGAAQSCSITINFTGNFNFGYKGALTVNDNGGGSPQTVSLGGFLP